MRTIMKFSCAGLAVLMAATAPAIAKECKDDSVTATSREYLSRSLGAFPGSWAAWRKEVKAEHGNGWQAWRRAEDREIKCEQIVNDRGRKRWTCTRSARPCRPGPGGRTTSGGPTTVDPGTIYKPISKVLRRGMKREEQVKTLQYLLGEAGYEVEIDGNFGRGTEQALRKFQRKSGIAVDGRAGPKTVEALTS